MRKVDIAICR